MYESFLNAEESEIFEDLLGNEKVILAAHATETSPIEAVRDVVVELRPDVSGLPLEVGEQHPEIKIAQALVMCLRQS